MVMSLLAFQHADSAFPSGSFAFSNGIEGYLALSGFAAIAPVRHFVDMTLRHRWIGTDRVALVHAFRDAGDLDRLAMIDEALEAATLAEPLRSGSRRTGRAFLTTHVRLKTPTADAIQDAIREGRLRGHLATMQGSLWHAAGLCEDDVQSIAGYQAICGLLSAAVRLGRISAIDAQAVIRDTLPILSDLLSEPVSHAQTIELRSFAPLIDIAALRGSGGSVRLFSN